MRVAHIITRLVIGGAQENTLLNCEDLIRDYGDSVLLVTGPTQGPEGTLMNRIRRSVPWQRPDEEVQSYCRNVLHGAVPHVIIPSMCREIRPWREWFAYRHILEVLNSFQPDVVHTHSAKAGILGRYAAKAANVPVVVHTVHGAPFYPWQNPLSRWFYRQCERAASKKCDAFISVADAMTDLMVQGKVASPDRFHTIYSGMETAPFLECDSLRQSNRQKYGFRQDDIVVGKVARLFHLKGHEFVIKAAKSVVTQVPNVRFLFVGDGTKAKQLAKMVDQAGLTDHFVFAGLIPPDFIPGMFAAMDILVHTSLREGLARVLPQALLCGKPVISYDVDGAREVVIDGKTGFLLPPCDTKLLAERIVQLAKDPELRQKLGNEGRKQVTQPFDHHWMTRQIRELYVQLNKG